MTITPQSIKEQIASRLASSGEAVANAVIQALADKELDRRKNIILDGLIALDKTEKAIRSTQPDQKQLDATGKVVGESYSQAKFNELKKQREYLEKLNQAFDKALNGGDFSSLEKAAKGNNDAAKPDSEG